MAKLPPSGTVLGLSELERAVRALRRAGGRVVWANGCYDVLHAGHVAFLKAARALGDLLVVGLNSDASVRRLKGPSRPLNRERHRAAVLAALRVVDYVVVFRGKTPLSLLERLKPEVYAKGGNYTLETLDQRERRLVKGYGGAIRFLPFVEDLSTTGLVRKMEDLSPPKARRARP
ncbi:MAG: D-glycero-beta-D-manno-heptose 1-phosphate adenylyltransferase [Planctomycetota bacterium]